MLLGTRARCALLLLACLMGDVGAWAGLADDRSVGPVGSGPTLVALVTAAAAWTVQAGLAWLTVLVALLLVDLGAAAPTHLTSYAGCPPALRRLLLVLCGVAVAGSLAAPSYADDDTGPGVGTGDRNSQRLPAARIEGLPLPDRVDPAGSAGSARSATEQAPRPAPQRDAAVREKESPPATPTDPAERGVHGAVVEVGAGDCLWDLARDALVEAGDPAPSAAEVDRAWRVLYAANRREVGPDPDLVQPGAALRIPDLTPEKENDR